MGPGPVGDTHAVRRALRSTGRLDRTAYGARMDASRTDAPYAPAASGPTSWPMIVVASALTGVATARMPVHRWSRRARWTLHGGLGLVTGVGTAAALRSPAAPGALEPSPRATGGGDQQAAGGSSDAARSDTGAGRRRTPAGIPATIGAAALAFAASAGASRGGEALDAWAERALTRRGARRPRAWIGAAAAAVSLVSAVVDRVADERA